MDGSQIVPLLIKIGKMIAIPLVLGMDTLAETKSEPFTQLLRELEQHVCRMDVVTQLELSRYSSTGSLLVRHLIFKEKM